MIDCTKFVETLNDKPVAVFGLGLSGFSTVKALVKAGAKVKAWDDCEDAREKAGKAGAEIIMLDKEQLEFCALLVLAPGVPLFFPKPHPVAKTAQDLGLEIICDLEILHRCDHGRKTIGVTGTNGKSTTTALISHILKSSGKDIATGGNIGKAVLGLDMPGEGGFFVLEVSSYQIDLCPTFRPDIAVLLNITPDHLDRHGSLKNYINVKQRIFEGEGLAVVSLDNEPCRKIYEKLLTKKLGDRRVRPFSSEGAVDEGNYVERGILYDARGGAVIEVGNVAEISALRGLHNQQNIAAAYSVCVSKDIGIEVDEIFERTQTFSGLPHRQFCARVINGIPYINDSKATNVEAVSKALSAYRNIYWIAGGRPKGDGLEDLHSVIPNVRHVFLIGEAMVAFAGWLDQYSVPYTMCGDLDNAVTQAHEMAQGERGRPGGAGAVLLSPACTSFDQFKSYEDRGNKFSELVKSLEEDDRLRGAA